MKSFLFWFLIFVLFTNRLWAAETSVEFNFVNAPVKIAIQQLALQANRDIKVDDSITDKITLSSKPIPLNKALELIKEKLNLQIIKNKNSIFLTRKKTSLKKHTISNKKVSSLKKVRSTYIVFYKLEFYPVDELTAKITQKESRIISGDISVQTDKNQNTLIVRANAADHEGIEQIIDYLDKPTPKIKISSRIVIAKDQASNELGFRLGAKGINENWSISGGLQRSANSINSFSDNLVVDLGLTQLPAISAGVGYQSGLNMLDLELQALASSGKINIVASPQVTVHSGSSATIATGTEVPYSRVVDNNLDIFFKEALIKLSVTPHLIGDDKVKMDIVIRLDNIGQKYNGIPSIDTNKLDTQVVLNNGETLILGGIFKTLNTTNVKKVPLLSEIPFLGVLFTRTSKVNEKAELMVFITPLLNK